MSRLESSDMWLDIPHGQIKSLMRRLLRRVGEEMLLVGTIRKRQKEWLSHTFRYGDLLTIVMEGRVEGKRPQSLSQAGGGLISASEETGRESGAIESRSAYGRRPKREARYFWQFLSVQRYTSLRSSQYGENENSRIWTLILSSLEH